MGERWEKDGVKVIGIKRIEFSQKVARSVRFEHGSCFHLGRVRIMERERKLKAMRTLEYVHIKREKGKALYIK